MSQIMNNIIPNKESIVDSMLELYGSIDKTNQYEKDLLSIDKDITIIEEKKSLAFDMVFKGELTRESLKSQFDTFESELNILKRNREDVLKQIEVLKNSADNVDKMSKYIQEELNGG